MSIISKILFPTDFSDSAINAFRYALWFADKFGATIELWHFVSPELAPADIPVVSGELTMHKVEIAKDVIKTFINTSMTQVQTAHELSNIPVVHGHVEVGSPVSNICDKAIEMNTDLIIMGTRGDHNSIDQVFGSVTTAILNKAPCPVLVIPDHVSTDSIDTVVFATDLNKSDPSYIGDVMKLLSPFNVRYKVVHMDDDSEDQHDLELEDIRKNLKNLTPDIDISFHNLIGKDKIDLLENFINRQEAQLLVMYRPQRSFFERLFHSSMTRKVVLHAPVPLLILK